VSYFGNKFLDIETIKHPGSFRDPSGFLYHQDGALYRSVSPLFKENYDHLIASGLYWQLTDRHLLISHEEIAPNTQFSIPCYKVLKPELLTFISYPYEWCFSQLKDAALATTNIHKMALGHDMELKDASSFNIQFLRGKPILIDTLSLQKCTQGIPWIAYRQFCQHFLAPLALMAYKDVRLSHLMNVFIDGIPLDLASKLLPNWTYLNPGLLLNIHLHARMQQKYAKKSVATSVKTVSAHVRKGLIEHLEKTIRQIRFHLKKTEWSNYQDECKYSKADTDKKVQIVEGYFSKIDPGFVWDMGANTGFYSAIAAKKARLTVAMDMDHASVEQHYQVCKARNEEKILPLWIDLTNPSPSLGWNHQERNSLQERGPADTIIALALIHHLAISNNVPLAMIAELFKTSCYHLIIEFVPKSDVRVQRLLSSRQDVFPDYNQGNFEKAFSRHFLMLERTTLPDTKRILYFMRRR
jgi:hypothetical protein